MRACACVQTISKAIVTCKSDDEDAYECATVTASADAYARATAQAHAEAVATAVKACGCMTESVSESISDESIYIKLIAEAASTATATACIEGMPAAAWMHGALCGIPTASHRVVCPCGCVLITAAVHVNLSAEQPSPLAARLEAAA